MTKHVLCCLGLAVMIGLPCRSNELPRLTPMLGSSVVKAVMKYFGSEGTEQATKYITKQGGKEVIERVTSTASRQGGDELLEQVARITQTHGPDAISAIDNVPSIAPVVKAINELPEAQAKQALSRLAAGTTGRELGETVAKHGTVVLKAELKHPGVGGSLARKLGSEGGELATELTTDQAIALARHADDIAKLPPTQRSGILSLIRKDAERMFGFIGRFVENNPGKVLFTAAGTTIILQESERMLGGDEIVFDADGNPVVVTKPGMLGRPAVMAADTAKHVSDNYLRPLFYAGLAFVVFFSGVVVWRKLGRGTGADA
ncbi:hypothetical protein Pla22_38600 [Rubripirellula amarantea]|uniref:Uncharacterized protein n=1 Tax=Rubripirellula amarantea TaxID=2527999 RepID=A0A5C5WM61_9BACT|nr:hypothetical protein [Rubripirellula amarantea]TWT51083.1 hypothetical protein Pla22_38600 [Rubripirellula amarantea]